MKALQRWALVCVVGWAGFAVLLLFILGSQLPHSVVMALFLGPLGVFTVFIGYTEFKKTAAYMRDLNQREQQEEAGLPRIDSVTPDRKVPQPLYSSNLCSVANGRAMSTRLPDTEGYHRMCAT